MLNRNKVISGIPDAAIVMIAVPNKIAGAIIEVVDTSVIDQNMSYRSGAGGIGFDLIQKMAKIRPDMPDDLKQKSLERYMDDCLMFELSRSGTTLSVGSLKANDDFIGIMTQAENPAVYTVIYDAASPTGFATTCSDAWSGSGGLKAYFSSDASYEAQRKAMCEQAGINPNDVNSYQSCKNLMDSHIALAASKTNPMPSIQYIRQAHFAQTLSNVLNESSIDKAAMALANQNMMSQGITTTIVANEYMPIIRGVVLAFSIVLLPVFSLFMVTGVFTKVIGQMTGLFVFLMFWEIMDAVGHVILIEIANGYFAEVAMSKTGYDSIMLAPSAAGKALGLFGSIRMMCVPLAATFASLAGFSSGALMSQAVGNMTSSVSAGASQGAQAATAAGAGEVQGKLESNMINTTVANARPDFMERTGAGAAHKQTQIASGNEMSKNMAGHEDVAATNARQELKTHQAQNEVAQDAGYQDRAQANAEASAGNLGDTLGAKEGEKAAWGKLGLNSEFEIAKFKKSGGIVTKDMAKSAKKNGMKGIVSGMKLDSMAVGENGEAMAKGSMAVTKDNVDEARELMRANGGDLAADAVHEGQMMNFDMNAKTGKGELDATQASRSKDGDTSSDVKSKKLIRQDTKEIDNSRTYKGGLHTDGDTVMQQALNGDKNLTHALYDREGNLDQAAMQSQADAATGKVQQMMSEHTNFSAGMKAELGLNLLGTGAGGFSEKSVSEQQNMIRSALRKKQDQLVQHNTKDGKFDKESFNQDYKDMIKKLFQEKDEANTNAQGPIESMAAFHEKGEGPGAIAKDGINKNQE